MGAIWGMSNKNWNNSHIQFARLLAEIEANGGFTDKLMDDLCASMNLERMDVCGLINRAQSEWDEIKAQIPKTRPKKK